jgi:hypothetical protein
LNLDVQHICSDQIKHQRSIYLFIYINLMMYSTCLLTGYSYTIRSSIHSDTITSLQKQKTKKNGINMELSSL